jgi:hypothetical protein
MDLEEQAAHIEAVEAAHIEAAEAVDSAVLVEAVVEALHIEQGSLFKGIDKFVRWPWITPSVIIFLCFNLIE